MTGRRNSGRSTFFLSLLKETYRVSGCVMLFGKIRFMNLKNSSIITGTMRDNIILGSRFEKEKYYRILDLVGLDINVFVGSDFVEILENGSNLTFQQKWKMILARMLYSDGDIYLIHHFFDELSPHERKEVFKKIVLKELKNKTVIFSSNDPKLMTYSEKLLHF